MTKLDDLIRFENENTGLDFKAVQYDKPKHQDLLKDVLAFANADTSSDRYIIVGVKHQADGRREILGVPEPFVDAAVYQQLVRENIEPELDLEYSPYEIDNKRVGIIRVRKCDQQPYLMKKDFGNLKRGDGYIRKGSHQLRLGREHFEAMYARRAETTDFSKTLSIGFDAANYPDEIVVNAVRNWDLTSDRMAAKIRGILEQRKTNPSLDIATMYRLPTMLTGPTPYEHRTTQELEKALESVKTTYKKDDAYDVFERAATKVNLNIENTGTAYVEDAAILVEIPRLQGLTIVTSPVEDPTTDPLIRSMPVFNRLHYPDVTKTDEQYIVKSQVGSIKHHQPNSAFQKRLRVVLGPAVEGKTIEWHCTLFGKNLAQPYQQTLRMRVE